MILVYDWEGRANLRIAGSAILIGAYVRIPQGGTDTTINENSSSSTSLTHHYGIEAKIRRFGLYGVHRF